MDTSEFYGFEDRSYINPTLSSGEQEAFISNLRDVQGQNNAQIAQQTYNLGTQVPSNLGGLGGGEAYFNARYQTPQVDEMVATLKAAADAQELNDIMTNYQAQLKNRYNQAQRAYNERERKRQRALQNAMLKSTTTPSGKVNVKTGNTPLAIEGLAWEKYKKDYGYSPFTPNPSAMSKKTGIPIESIMAANDAYEKYRADSNKQQQQQQAAFQPMYSGQLILNNR